MTLEIDASLSILNSFSYYEVMCNFRHSSPKAKSVLHSKKSNCSVYIHSPGTGVAES
jgi:hypothetical protein